MDMVSSGIFVLFALITPTWSTDFTLVTSLGMGRSEVGSVGNGTGYNAYPLLDKENNRVISNVKITPTGEFEFLLIFKNWSMEEQSYRKRS